RPPTSSKYRARLSLVTGLPSPPTGYRSFSGVEISTPITLAGLSEAGTVLLLPDLGDLAFTALTALFATAGLTISGVAGFSATTSRAGLSWRSPLKAAWRIFPASV